MPFTIMHSDFTDVVTDTKEVTWYINEGKPAVPKHRDVVEFFAIGEAADIVRLKFRNLPITAVGACTWKGDLAQFIYDNL